MRSRIDRGQQRKVPGLTDSIADVFSLVRAGAVEAARQAFHAAGLDQRLDDPAALTLQGRLLKESASLATGAERTTLLAAAADCYKAAARLEPATYPLINAATLSLLGGAGARAAQLATETLALLDSGAHEPDTRYWLGATRAEALLLLGREVEARAALREAIAGTPRAWEDHAVTLRQFRLILAEQGRSSAWLDACRPPAPVHYAGPIGLAGDARLEAGIEAAIGQAGPGIAVGALAAGFDIIAAELLVRRGAELHVVLPAPPELFVKTSVVPAGEAWRSRFDALLAGAASVDILDLPAGLSAGAAVLAEEMALGCAIRSARLLDVDAVLLRHVESSARSGEPERAGVRRIEARGGLAGQGGLVLGPPDRPAALLGCPHADAERLGTVTAAPVQFAPAGAFVVLDDLEAAADAAIALFGDTHAVLDYAPPCPDGAADTAALEALLAMPARGYPVATRPAALAIEARRGAFRLALAGASSGLGEAVDFFSLWCARPQAPTASAAS